MDLKSEIEALFSNYNAKIKEKKGIYTATCVIAERKVMLSTKKLEYIAKYRIDDKTKELRFTEMLQESGSGMDAGAGFKTETYNTFKKPREGSINEQSELFGKSYSYKFDFKTIRSNLEQLANKYGYKFNYQITSVGL